MANGTDLDRRLLQAVTSSVNPDDLGLPLKARLGLMEEAVKVLQIRLTTLETLVRRMRSAQRVYFKTRDRAVMVEAKTLEREVDRVLAP